MPMGRWDFDDERSTAGGSGTGGGGRGAPSRHDEEPRIHALSERGSLRARDQDDTSREHALTLPAGPSREAVRDEARLYHLRGSEVDLLERAGRYRVAFTDDLQADVKDAAPGAYGSGITRATRLDRDPIRDTAPGWCRS
jgi:hypothetical protein